MESEDEARAAIAALDGHTIHGGRITVEVLAILCSVEILLLCFFLH